MESQRFHRTNQTMKKAVVLLATSFSLDLSLLSEDKSAMKALLLLLALILLISSLLNQQFLKPRASLCYISQAVDIFMLYL